MAGTGESSKALLVVWSCLTDISSKSTKVT